MFGNSYVLFIPLLPVLECYPPRLFRLPLSVYGFHREAEITPEPPGTYAFT